MRNRRLQQEPRHFVQDARGNTGNVAGQGQIYVNQSFPLIKNSYHESITAASGGTRLQSMEIGELLIGSVSGNHLMYIGGIDNDAPFSGRGIPLYAGPNNERRLPVLNANLVSVYATFSGELVYYMGFLNGQNTSLNPEIQGTQPNNAPPVLVSTSPQAGSDSVFITSGVSFITFFDEDIASGTVDASSYQIKLSGQTTFTRYLSGTVSYYDPNSSGSRSAIQIQPVSGQLQASSWYNVFIATTLTDDPGTALPSSLTWSFLTAGAPDNQAPSGTSFVPLSGATSVVKTTDLTVTFDEIVSGTPGGSFSNIRLWNSGSPGTAINGATSMDATKTKLVFTPTASLTDNDYYRWAVSGVKDPYGNTMIPESGISFQVAAADATGPTVSSTIPASGDTNIELATSFAVTFDEVVSGDPNSTIDEPVISMILSGFTATEIAGAITLDSARTTMTFDPTEDLLASKIYEFRVSGVLDASDNYMTPNSGIAITTIGSDTTPPAIIAVSPTINSTNVSINVEPNITYSEQISGTAGGSVTSQIVKIKESGGATLGATLALDAAGKIITLTPSAALSGDRWYQIEASGAYDLNDNQQTVGLGLSFPDHGFKTEDTIPPVFSGSAGTQTAQVLPSSGTTSVSVNYVPRGIANESLSGVSNETYNVTVISVYKKSAGNEIAGTRTLGGFGLARNKIDFTPTGGLEYNTLYEVRISGIKDTNDNFCIPVSGHSFTTESAPLSTFYDQVGNTEQAWGTFGNKVIAAGELRNTSSSSFNGRKPKRATFALKRTGSPGGTLHCRIRKNVQDGGGDDGIAVEFDTTYSANSISTSKTRYSFSKLSNTYALTTNDAIMVELTGSNQNSSNYISVYYDGSDPFNGGSTCFVSHDSDNYNTHGESRDIDGKFEE